MHRLDAGNECLLLGIGDEPISLTLVPQWRRGVDLQVGFLVLQDGGGALSNERALQLSHAGDDGEHHAAHRTGSIHHLPTQVEDVQRDVRLVPLASHAQGVFGVTEEAIQLQGDDVLHLAGSHQLQQFFATRAMAVGVRPDTPSSRRWTPTWTRTGAGS
ncbi:MAG: hypothetical protein BWY76_00284 [bacterium ADurb.Bin429]|nr:MAG: hypothetical protein BWY76_00284 [bacterium ADurb.Bin429]